jgi:hypothetical protein
MFVCQASGHRGAEVRLPLILVAETNGPTMFARIGMLQAINRHKPVEFDPKTQKPAGGQRKLARDRARHLKT